MKKPTFIKTLLATLIFICFNTEEILAYGAVQRIDVIEINNGTSNTLQEAITNLDESGTIIIKGKISIDQSIIIPIGVTLDVKKGAMIEVKGVDDFKICGPVTAGLYQIFSGTVKFLEEKTMIISLLILLR